jgi:hypothetical protein
MPGQPVVLLELATAQQMSNVGCNESAACTIPQVIQSGSQKGTIVGATIYFNPFYADYMQALLSHEFGHGLFGWDDCLVATNANCVNSIMMSPFNYQTQPSGPTPCDAQHVGQTRGSSGGGTSPPPPTPPDCQSGQCTSTGCVPACTGEETWNSQLCACEIATSPIIIDTDGSGFHLTSTGNGVQFDFLGDGKSIWISWTQGTSTNGWGVLDRNGNGIIDSGKEMFGNITDQPPSDDPNGFRALAVFDQPSEGGNDDGVIDAQDAVWPHLQVWVDKNHDGISQKDELFSLEDVGISAIRLGYTLSKRYDEYGNIFRYKGSLRPTSDDKVSRVIYDVFLVPDLGGN